MLDLTIVVPVYNVEKFLPECLESLPNNCRIILVDDGSTDKSGEICKAYAGNRENIRVITKENGGLSDARNAGINFVETDYVFFLDSDDYIDSQALIHAFEFASKRGLDWVQCGYAYLYEHEAIVFKAWPGAEMLSKSHVMDALVEDGYIKNFAWGKIYRTEIVRRHPFPKGKFFEDSFWQHLIVNESESFGVWGEVATFYRQRSGSISGKFSTRNLDLLEGLEQRLKFFIANTPQSKQRLAQAAFQLWSVAEESVKLAEGTSEELYATYSRSAKRIKCAYRELISTGISLQSFLIRQEMRTRFSGHDKIGKMLNVANRIADRLTPDSYKKIKISKCQKLMDI